MSSKGLISKAINFFSEVKQETSRVTWPSRRETIITTIFVFVMALIGSVFFMLVDQGIYKTLYWIIG